MNQKKLYLLGKAGAIIEVEEYRKADLKLPEEFKEFGDFVIHASPNLADPAWTVTHIESGAAVCRADSVTMAEFIARDRLVNAGVEGMRKAINKLKEMV